MPDDRPRRADPVSLSLGLLGLVAFVWSLRARQYDDPEGDQYRALFGGNDEAPRTDAQSQPKDGG